MTDEQRLKEFYLRRHKQELSQALLEMERQARDLRSKHADVQKKIGNLRVQIRRLNMAQQDLYSQVGVSNNGK